MNEYIEPDKKPFEGIPDDVFDRIITGGAIAILVLVLTAMVIVSSMQGDEQIKGCPGPELKHQTESLKYT